MNTPQPEPRLFHLVRPSGTVAEGVEWSDGTVTLRWRGQWPATSVWEGGVDAVLAVHAPNGTAELRWLPALPSTAPLSTTLPSTTPPSATHLDAAPTATPAAQTAGTASVGRGMEWEVANGLRLAAPGVDGRCVSCGLVWPCLSCGP